MKNNQRPIIVYVSLIHVLFFAASLSGAVSYTKAPELIPNPSGKVPLAAVVEFETKEKLDTHVELTDGTNSWDAHIGRDEAKDGKYQIPLLGMRQIVITPLP